MRRSITTIALVCAAAAAVAGCGQTQDAFNALQDKAFSAPGDVFSKPDDLFKVPEWGQANKAPDNFNLGPKGPVSANNLISASGYCSPAAEPATPPAQARTQAQTQAQAAAEPPPDRLQPAGLEPAGLAPAPGTQFQPVGGVSLGMSECTVARRLGTPGNVSISAGPKGERRVVLTYREGPRPGLYSFESGRLIQVDATPQQARKLDRNANKRTRRTRGRSTSRMYVQ